jgi:peptide-methionine (S)-S-oxide reductase
MKPLAKGVAVVCLAAGATLALAAGKEPAMTQHAMFGAGCFWGVEEAFRQVKGVTKTAVGFAGGTVPNPSYEQVCYKNTGHAEVVHLEFDPSQVTYDQLLDVLWKIHNPTTLNRQGPDVGSQYRSAIFYYTPEQKAAAEASKERLAKSGTFKNKIVTEITEAGPFYRAEEYHQRYFQKRGGGQCHLPL